MTHRNEHPECQMSSDHGQHRAGFVALLGPPNVGKSSLLNRILENRVSIVSEKPQTTRRIVRGILNQPDAQLVFLDTPGFHEPKDPLGESLFASTKQSLLGTDIVCYLGAPDVREQVTRSGKLPGLSANIPVFMVANKMDLLAPPERLSYLDRLEKKHSPAPVIAVSALTGEGIEHLLGQIVSCLPEHPPYFGPDFFTDSTERDICSELIRESAWNNCFQEIPYGIEVRVEEFRERGEKTYIQAIVYVEREAHKKIVIGRGGQTLKAIGSQARANIEKLLGRKVYLDLWIKVEKNWRKRVEILRKWGYRTS